MSTSELPPVAPRVLADAVDALPGRLRKRLDEVAAQALTWPTTVDPSGAVDVTVDAQTTVRLAAQVRRPEDAVCGCLLAPRCLHRTALLAAAPVLDLSDSPSPSPATSAVAATASVHASTSVDESSTMDDSRRDDQVPRVVITDAQRECARRLWQAALPVLENGIPGAGVVVQAQLLRAVHDANNAGLPRASAAAVRIVESLRSARADEPRFRLADLTDDLRELLSVCHQLVGGHGDAARAKGTARREYEDVGSLRLWGVFAEPFLSTSGYAGATSYLCDEHGRLWMVSDIRPGGIEVARSAVTGDITIGDARLSHHAVARAGLVVNGARAPANGRLSSSTRTQAVRSTGRGWTESPLDRLWAAPAVQLGRYAEALSLPVPVRPAGYDLAFLTGTLRTTHSGLALAVAGLGPVNLIAGLSDRTVPVVANLRQLARDAAGREAMLIGRIAGPLTMHALALAAPWLSDRHGGHVDLVADVMQRSDLPGALDTAPIEAGPATVTVSVALQLMRHRIERAVSGGRAAIRTPSAPDVLRLTASHFPYGATLLAALHDAVQQRTRDVFGRLNPLDSDQLGRAWLALAEYAAGADRHVVAATWLPPSDWLPPERGQPGSGGTSTPPGEPG